MKRIDTLLKEMGIVESRNKAQQMIQEGFVKYQGKVVSKASQKADKEGIEIIGQLDYVGRGRRKLQKAFEYFDIKINDKICIDIGASTGGFTEELLSRGAKKVYAVDVGQNQLHSKLRNDPRVVSFEDTDARDLEQLHLGKIDFGTMDVSFISIRKILPKIIDIFHHFEMLVLVKPQFESQGKFVNTWEHHQRILDDLVEFLEEEGFILSDMWYSEFVGSEGNIEYFFHLTREEGPSVYRKNLAQIAFKQLH
ncbi:MAG: TlyA family RNA methyltransferase [Tissierellia bacterium]|nr:TlyA family RNA methyltransferase [Tissierellia bacterium]